MHFISIRRKLIAIILTITILMVVILQAINLVLVYTSFSRQIDSTMEAGLKNAHMQITSGLNENFRALGVLTLLPSVRDDTLSLAERAVGLEEFVKKNSYRGVLACAVTDLQGNAALSSGIKIDVSQYDFFQRAITGKSAVSDPFVSDVSGKLIIVYAMPYYNSDGKLSGAITMDMDALHLSNHFEVDGLGESGVAFVIAQNGNTVASTDPQTVTDQLNDFDEVVNDPDLAGLIASEEKMVAGETGRGEHEYYGVRELIFYMPVDGTSWSIAVTKSRAEVFETTYTLTYISLGLLALFILISILVGTRFAKSISGPIVELAEAANRLADGDIDISIEVKTKDEINNLAKSFQRMTESIQNQSEAIGRIATGDYTVSVPVRSDKDVMNEAINHLVEWSNSLMGEIRNAAEQIAKNASQIANGAQAVANGSVQQTESIQGVSSVVHELSGQAISNTELADTTVKEVTQAGILTGESISSMSEMTSAMNTIDESSKAISQIIRVIDDIAFQTNILALNAAVEAARAGVQGKGFSVVADEVRNLAGKSATAAKETASLIETSVKNVSSGVEIVEKIAAELGEVDAISRANIDAMEKISKVSEDQSTSVREINESIEDMSKIMKSNSSNAAQSAALAKELNRQSELLFEIVDRFKLL